MSVSDKGDIQNVQSSGSPGPGLKTTGVDSMHIGTQGRCCAEIGDLAKTVTRDRCSANVRAEARMLDQTLKPNDQEMSGPVL